MLSMDAEALKGPMKRFLTAMGVKAGQEPSEQAMANIRAGQSARGVDIVAYEYQRQIHATKQPVRFIDLTFSMDKTAPTNGRYFSTLPIAGL
jgi:hypothetical protein